MDEVEIDKLLKPELKLFLSVDVIDSTAYKNDTKKSFRKNKVQPWLNFFFDFYNEFPLQLARSCKDVSSSKEFSDIMYDVPAVWKTLGDELVFCMSLGNHKQAAFYLAAFKCAIEAYNKKTIKQKEVQVKGTAWTVGFPVFNAKIQRNNSTGTCEKVQYEDYLGPHMDIGFRLSKYASVEFVIVSVDLTLMCIEHSIADFPLRFVYKGKETLKGVNNKESKPINYPIIGLLLDFNNVKRNNVSHKHEKNILNSAICSKDELKGFCKNLIAEIGEPLMIPFIDGDDSFNIRPNGYDDKLKALKELYVELYGRTMGDFSRKDSSKSSKKKTIEKKDISKFKTAINKSFFDAS